MRNKLRTIVSVTFILFLFSVSAFACTCSYDDLKARGFSGQIISIAYDKKVPDFNNPIPKATLKLLKRVGDENKVVAEIVADESGHFSLDSIKPGKYFLQVEFPNFSDVFVQVKVSAYSRGRKDKIIIALAPGLKCCEGYVKVEKSL